MQLTEDVFERDAYGRAGGATTYKYHCHNNTTRAAMTALLVGFWYDGMPMSATATTTDTESVSVVQTRTTLSVVATVAAIVGKFQHSPLPPRLV